MLCRRILHQKLLNRKSSNRLVKRVSKAVPSSVGSVNWTTNRKRKREVLDDMKNKSKAEKKRKEARVSAENVDRISELPEAIIHQILSHIRCARDAARTSVLSKRWRNMWISFLTFEFDQKSFRAKGQEQIEQFKDFVENTVSTRLEAVSFIEKFRLCMTSFDVRMATQVSKWISAATAKNVKDLEIYLEAQKKGRYRLPRAVFSINALTSLKLNGCRFDNRSNINLPNLRVLSLKDFHLSDFMIRSFIRGCPLMEDFRLISCRCLEILHISGLARIKRIEVHECLGLKSVEINAPSLNTFWYYRHICKPCEINLDACKNLESLTLKDNKMTDELFQDLISKFPVLERLVLRECHSLKEITVTCQKLKRLVLFRCNNLEKADIDVPHLSSFEYTGINMPFSSMNTSGLHEAKIYFESIPTNTLKYHIIDWSVMLRKFLENFDQSQGYKLVERHEKVVIIYEDCRDSSFLLRSNVKLDIVKSSTTIKALVDSLLRIYHPHLLSIVSSSSSELLKFLCEKVITREKKPSCCKYYSRKCWQHYLKDVKVETSGGNETLSSSEVRNRATVFRLNWKSDEQRR